MEPISKHGSPAKRCSRNSSSPCFYSDARKGRICIGNEPIFSSSSSPSSSPSSSSDECLGETMIPMELSSRKHFCHQSLPSHDSYTPRSRPQIKPKLWLFCSSIEQTSANSSKPQRRGRRRGISSILFHSFFASISCKDISIAGSDHTSLSSSKAALFDQCPTKDSPLKALTTKNGEKKVDLSKLQKIYGEGAKHLKVEEASSNFILPYVGRSKDVVNGKKNSVNKDKKVVDSCLLSSKFDVKEVTVIPEKNIRVLVDPQDESRKGNKASFKNECILDSEDTVYESSLESDELELVGDLGISCKENPSPQDVSTHRYFRNINNVRDNHRNQKSKQCVKNGCTQRSRIFTKTQPEAEECNSDEIQALTGDMPNLCMGLNSVMEEQASSFPPNGNVGFKKMQMREDNTNIISTSTSIINSTEQQSPVSVLDADFEGVSKALVEEESDDDNPSLRSLASFQDTKRKLMERVELYEQLRSMYFSMFETYMHCRCSKVSPKRKTHSITVDDPLSQYIWEKPNHQLLAWDAHHHHHLPHPYPIKGKKPGSSDKWADFTTEKGEIVEELERSLIGTLLHDELVWMLLHSS